MGTFGFDAPPQALGRVVAVCDVKRFVRLANFDFWFGGCGHGVLSLLTCWPGLADRRFQRPLSSYHISADFVKSMSATDGGRLSSFGQIASFSPNLETANL